MPRTQRRTLHAKNKTGKPLPFHRHQLHNRVMATLFLLRPTIHSSLMQ